MQDVQQKKRKMIQLHYPLILQVVYFQKIVVVLVVVDTQEKQEQLIHLLQMKFDLGYNVKEKIVNEGF